MSNQFKEESNTIEYKKTLPSDANKWLKSIVSFSNTSGGELIVGVEDSTLTVYGITDVRSVFEQKIMETIFNNIEPKPIVDIVFKHIGDKDIAIIQVAKGNNQPYFIKNQGIEDGCYIRYGSTDQKATISQRLEMVLNSNNESFTDQIYDNEGKPLKLKEINFQDFLVNINKNVKTGKQINLNKLLQWQLIKQTFGENYVTNGLMLLLENESPINHVRIGFFSGTTKAQLVDDIDVKGSIIHQYEESMSILLNKLRTSFKIDSKREQQYKIPEVALREIIANAIVHRNYLEQGPIRISVFDNRIEIFSPGTFFDGLQLEDALGGISKLRNPNICEVFYHIGIIEKWGSGIFRANEALEQASMYPLIFEINSIHGVNVIIKYDRDNIMKTRSNSLNEDNYLSQKQSFTRNDLQQDLNMSYDQARYLIEKWLEKGKISKRGGGPRTKYEVHD